MDKILAIVIGYKGGHPLNWCMQGLTDQQLDGELDIVLWDNGGHSEQSIMARYPGCHGERRDFVYHKSEENLLWTPAINAALDLYLADHDYIIIMNQDLTIPPFGVSRMIDTFKTLPAHAGAVAPAGSGIGGLQDYGSHDTPPSDFYGPQLDIIDKDPRRAQYLIGCCVMYKREVLETVGSFDNSMPLSGDDFDYAIRMKEVGYSLWALYNVCVDHACHTTGNSSNWDKYGSSSWAAFDQKYAGYYANEDEAKRGLWNTEYDPEVPIGTGISREEKIKRGIINE